MPVMSLPETDATIYYQSINHPERSWQSHLPSSLPESPDWNPVVDELLKIRSYEDDWDGEGSLPPDKAIVDTTIRLSSFLKALGVRVPDFVHASVNATVLMEWSNPRFYHEMEIFSPTRARLTHLDRTTNQVIESIEFSI